MSNHPINVFDFVLPLEPHTGRIGDEPFSAKCNGKDLQGVTDLTLRCGANGLTNVVIGYEASIAVKAVAMHVASIRLDDHVGEELLERIYDTAIQEAVGRDAPGAVIVRRIVEMLAENF